MMDYARKGRSVTWRMALLAVCAVTATTGLAACSGSASTPTANVAAAGKPANGCPKAATATIWGIVTSTVQEATDSEAAEAFEKACPGAKIDFQYYNNTDLKTKISTAMAAGTAPTLFQTQGGPDLETYVNDGKVVALDSGLTQANPSWKSQLLGSALTPGTFSGKTYAFPVFGAEPMLLFYNKAVFSKLGLTAPTTVTELFADAAKIKAAGITPIAMGDQDKFPSTFWLQYLVDREGGSAPFTGVTANKANAWSNPAIISGLQDLQTLAKDGDFGTGYDSYGDVSGAATALLYSGKAAMKIDGTWIQAEIQAADPGFLTANDLGFVQFPTGSSGYDDVYGTASSLYALTTSASSAQQAVAEAFMATELTTKAYAQRQIAVGVVPAVAGVSSDFPNTLSGKLGAYSYETAAQHASTFETNWDNSLGTQETNLESNTSSVASLALSPSGFASNMNATLG